MRYMLLQRLPLLRWARAQHQSCNRHLSQTLSARPELLREDVRSPMDSYLFSSIIDLVQFGAFVAFVTKYCANITQCTGPSMLPTISTGGDVLLTVPTRLCKLFGLEAPQLGDVIISISPSDRTQTVCKRVLGMPGDTLLTPPPPGWPASYARDVTVPRGHVWLQGDNTEDSTDSRSYGPVPLALVQAIVVCRLYPLRDAGRLPALPPERLPIRTSSDHASQAPERKVEAMIRLPPTAPVLPTEPATCEGTVSQQNENPVLKVPAPSLSLHFEGERQALFGHIEAAEPAADTHDTAVHRSRAVTAELESLLPELREAIERRPDGCAELLDATVQLAGAADELQRALQHHQRSSKA